MLLLLNNHWYVGAGTPVAVTENAALCESVTIRLCGCEVMTGVTMTVRVALLVAMPTVLLATNVYTYPFCAYWTLVRINGVPVAPGMSTPFSCHFTDGEGKPATEAWNVPLLP